MKWSLKLGTVAGTPRHLHWTFVLLLGWVVNAEDPLEQALARMRQGQCAALPVVRGERFVGLLTHEKISYLILVNSARHGERGRHATAAGMAH